MHKIFFSWQSDTDPGTSLTLVKKALLLAVERLNLDLELDEATRNQPGSSILFETIREKIASCAIFVPDLTFIGRSEHKGKRLPNPNVLVEYGCALASLPAECIVPIMNLHFGDIEQLPFDLRHRAIKISYDLSPRSTETEREIVSNKIAQEFQTELRLAFESGALFSGLSRDAVRVAKRLSDLSDTGWGGQGDYAVGTLAADLSMEASDVNRSLRELEALGYVKRLGIAGTDAPPAIPTDHLFWDFDHYFHGWNPRKDAKTLLKAMLKDGRHGANCRTLAEELSWDVRRINPALRYVASGRLVLASNETSYPLATPYIRKNERTEAFISGILDPEKRS